MALHGSPANPWPTNMDKTNVLGTERNILEQRGRGGYGMKTVRSTVRSSALKPNSFWEATDTVTAGVFSHCQKAATGLGQAALLPRHCHQEARKRCLQRHRAASLSVMGQGMMGTETPGGMQANTCRGSESRAPVAPRTQLSSSWSRYSVSPAGLCMLGNGPHEWSSCRFCNSWNIPMELAV